MGIHSTVIQKLLTTNSHVGRRIISHHLKPYVHGTRNSVAIIDSDKTLISLRSALSFIGHLTRSRVHSTKPARFLFVNTNPLYDHIFDHMTRLTGFGSFLSTQSQFWRLSGSLTNPCSPKKFTSRNKKLRFAPIEKPDCVFVVDLDNKSSVIDEAFRIGVPVIALVDSTTPLDHYNKIAYPIVVGGESVQFVYMMCNLVTKTLRLEKGLIGIQHDDVAQDANVVDKQLTATSDANVDASSEQATLKDANETTEEISCPSSEQATLKDANETTAEISGPSSEQATLKDANETTEEISGPSSMQATLKDANETTEETPGPPSEQATMKDANETTEELKNVPHST